jgi:hypothetical protein
MTYRTTKKDLDKLEKELNQLLGYPTERDPRKYSIGNIYYQGVADYWNIEQVVNSGLGAMVQSCYFWNRSKSNY